MLFVFCVEKQIHISLHAVYWGPIILYNKYMICKQIIIWECFFSIVETVISFSIIFLHNKQFGYPVTLFYFSLHQVSTIVCKCYLRKILALFTIRSLREGVLLSSLFDFPSISRTDRPSPQGLFEYSRHAPKQNKSPLPLPPYSTVLQDTSKVTWLLHTFTI